MTTPTTEKITCQICGDKVHVIQTHLRDAHPEVTLEEYKSNFPDAPLLSETAKQKLRERAEAKKAEASDEVTVVASSVTGAAKQAMHDVFKLGAVKAAMNAQGGPILVTVLNRHETYGDLIPDVDDGYVWDIEGLKTMLMAIELNIPGYRWGHAGTGKTTGWEQLHARTNRPFLRVQHTPNTEESHILGQYVVKDGHTVFEPGPLAICMKYGLTYCADEYDFALPSTLSVYQPVLEGKALVIKEAPPEWRIVRPHPNFRFVATGNTNGCGDETGLYQGTNIQNAANYERFGIVDEVGYMSKKQEALVIMNQAEECPKDIAEKLVDFAGEVRKAYAAGKIGSTVSPRALINAAKVGMRRADMKLGLALSFSNRLTRVDKETCDQFAQRVFG